MQYDVALISIIKCKGNEEKEHLSVWECRKRFHSTKERKSENTAETTFYKQTYMSTWGGRKSMIKGL